MISIVFEFDDGKGNSSGIGNKVFVYYGPDEGLKQMREIKSGGGYLSFDAYQAHFGLGSYDTVDRLEMHWSTGQKSVLRGKFQSGHRCRIVRTVKGEGQEFSEAADLPRLHAE